MQFQLAPFSIQQCFHSVKSNHSPYKTNSTSFPFFKSFYHFASAEPMDQVFQLPPFLLKISLNFHPFFSSSLLSKEHAFLLSKASHYIDDLDLTHVTLIEQP